MKIACIVYAFSFFAPRDIFITTNENIYEHKQLLKFYREAGVYMCLLS